MTGSSTNLDKPEKHGKREESSGSAGVIVVSFMILPDYRG